MSDLARESLRLFIALWPDDATAAALMHLQAPMHGRIVPYANLHLTLAFLGQQDSAVLPTLKDILQHLPKTAITLRLDRIGYFPRNRIIWAGMHEVPDSLNELRAHLVQSLGEHRIPFDDQRSFKPHITLARDATAPSDHDFAPIVWNAKHIALVQSVTMREGSSYQLLTSRLLDRNAVVADEAGNDEVDTSQ